MAGFLARHGTNPASSNSPAPIDHPPVGHCLARMLATPSPLSSLPSGQGSRSPFHVQHPATCCLSTRLVGPVILPSDWPVLDDLHQARLPGGVMMTGSWENITAKGHGPRRCTDRGAPSSTARSGRVEYGPVNETGRAASRTAVLVCQGRAAADGSVAVGRFSDPVAVRLLRAEERTPVDDVRAGVPPQGWPATLEVRERTGVRRGHGAADSRHR